MICDAVDRGAFRCVVSVFLGDRALFAVSGQETRPLGDMGTYSCIL